jgi:hypothetical protein
MARRALRSLLLLAALLLACLQRIKAADWPLTGYAPCGVSTTPQTTTIVKPWDNASLQLNNTASDIAFNDDDNLLWITSKEFIYKYRYSDGAFLSSLNLGTVISGGGFIIGAELTRTSTMMDKMLI